MASNSLYGNQYSGVEIVQFQWFIFQSSSTAPATPTGGSWNFQTGVGTPPSGWSDAPPASPSNEVWVSIALVSSLSPSTFTWSAPGLWYQQGAAGQVAVGTTTTLSPGASATVNNSGTSYNAVLNFGIPQGIQGPTGSTGPTGPTGSAATIAVGTTTTLSSGSSATVNNSGSSSAATFNFGIPQGIPGTAATIAVGTTTTTNPGTSATVTNSGTSNAAVFNFGIPKGYGVSSGGTTGQALIKNSNADYDTTWTTITGTLAYQGSWNASTNTPTLTSSVGTNGYYYIVSVAGTTNLNGIIDWQPNDWAIFNGSFWQKIDNSDLVTSVNSYTGAVVLTNTDVGAPTYAGVGATGTWPISVTGNSATVTNGVYTSGSYSNPTWITGLAGSKVTAIPNSSLTNSSVTINGNAVSLGGSTTVTAATPNSLTFGTGLSTGSFNGSSAATVSIANSGVTAGTYGSASVIPVLTVNAQGQLTSISTQATNAPSYQGTWNASTNTPTLTSSVGTQGFYYVVSVAGNTNLNGNAVWSVGDWAIFANGAWDIIPGSTSESFTNLTTTNLAVTGLTGYMYANGSGNVTAGTTIPNAGLANSTISGVSLGSNLFNLTAGTNITFSSGTTYNGSSAITINASSTMVYPGAGIPNSTGSAWGTSYSTTGTGTVLALATSPTFVTPVLGTPTSGNFSTGTFTWPTFNQNTTGTASNVTGIVAVANGGTGVTSSSGANSVVLRDSNGNITTNCLFEGYTNQVASGTTVVLTASSVQNWIITGSGGQTIKLPDATTLPVGATFTFNNNQSSGTLVIQNNSSTTVATVQSGGYITVFLLINSPAAGSWDFHNSAPSNASWSTNTLSWVGSYTGGTWNGNAVGLLYGGTNANLTAVNGGAVYSTGSALAITAAGTSGQVLTSNGASAPTWTTLSIGGGTF